MLGSLLARITVILIIFIVCFGEGLGFSTGTLNEGSSYGEHGDLTFKVFAPLATRIEVWLYSGAFQDEKHRVLLTRDGKGFWQTTISHDVLKRRLGRSDKIFYGYRAWGPNWPYDATWQKGETTGFKLDVDAAGNRFNPNKLLIDPYSIEISHDPMAQSGLDSYRTGEKYRRIDTGTFAPKSIAIKSAPTSQTPKPTRPLSKDIVYEVHLRGLTINDKSVSEEERGTYLGAARKAPYLKSLGITAIEFLPLYEKQNDANDKDPTSAIGDDYWGYDGAINFFAPDRRYATDKSPGGPTREIIKMVDEYHKNGIKVIADVVYNHSREWHPDVTGTEAEILSLRGLSNQEYYVTASSTNPTCSTSSGVKSCGCSESASGGQDFILYCDRNGVGPNINAESAAARRLVISSLRYWALYLGFDGFRFDLANILANSCIADCYKVEPQRANGLVNQIAQDLPARSTLGGNGVDLIAEAWGAEGSYPSGWAELNGRFRDSIRRAQNKHGIIPFSPSEIATRVAGSSDLFGGRGPGASLNFIINHDGFTLKDLYSCNNRNNEAPWPHGPSSGGREYDDEMAWDNLHDETLQRQAARTGFALLMLSAGVPMVGGGDEFLRTQYCNNNPYNIDSKEMGLDFGSIKTQPHYHAYVKKLVNFRGQHPMFSPSKHFLGKDGNGNNVKDITWYTDTANEATENYFKDVRETFLGYRIDGSEFSDSIESAYVAYNWSQERREIILPKPPSSKYWYRVADTASFMEDQDNFKEVGREDRLESSQYNMVGRSILLLIAK